MMCGSYTQEEVRLMNCFRQLWEQHVYWTRFFIISTAADLGDLKPVTDRLLQNPGDFARALAPFYGAGNARRFQELLTQHLQIAASLINADKQQNRKQADGLREKWRRNTDEIAAFLACLNPCWDEASWKTMLCRHLEMTEQQAVLRLQGRYEADVKIFGDIEDEALKMADLMSCGIIRQHLRS